MKVHHKNLGYVSILLIKIDKPSMLFPNRLKFDRTKTPFTLETAKLPTSGMTKRGNDGEAMVMKTGSLMRMA